MSLMPVLRIPIAHARPNVTVTVNTIWPLVLTLVLVFSQLFFPSRVWIALLWTLGGLTGLAYVWAQQMARHVVAQRELRYGWMQVGDRLEERFSLANSSWLPVLWTEVLDESDLPGYEVRRVASCNAFSTVYWTTDQECTRRGLFTLGPWSLRVGDPFGFLSVTFRHGESEAIVVYPPVVDLPEITLPRGLVSGPSRARRQIGEATIDASHTRLYQPSDPLRNIHWPSTAHRGTLIVRDPDAEISGDLWIVLDLDRNVQVGQDDESTEEYGIILAASLADRTLRQNRAVGLVAHGQDLIFVPPGRGKGHMWRILQALAVAKAGGTHPLAEVLHQLRQSLGHGTSVLVITPSSAPDWVDALMPLTRSGIAPTAVLLDAASFASRGSGAKPMDRIAGIRTLLAKAGISAHVIRQGYPFRHLVPLRRRGHWEFKTSPMGRAVLVRRPDEG
jgi:uncharacterized protein (DUF58 family)